MVRNSLEKNSTQVTKQYTFIDRLIDAFKCNVITRLYNKIQLGGNFKMHLKCSYRTNFWIILYIVFRITDHMKINMMRRKYPVKANNESQKMKMN